MVSIPPYPNKGAGMGAPDAGLPSGPHSCFLTSGNTPIEGMCDPRSEYSFLHGNPEGLNNHSYSLTQDDL